VQRQGVQVTVKRLVKKLVSVFGSALRCCVVAGAEGRATVGKGHGSKKLVNAVFDHPFYFILLRIR
jgi:hypothetical protein